MNSQKKVLPMALSLAVVVGVVLGALGFYFLMNVSSNGQMNSGSGNSGNSNNSGNNGENGMNNGTYTATTSTSTLPVDTSSWQTYTDYELGFSIHYPPDVTIDDTSNLSDVVFTFPSTYFSTVMQDTDSVTVSVNVTCTPMTSYSDNGPIPAQTVTVDGITFTENYQYDAGAGSHEALTTYDTEQNNACYRLSYLSHGGNDASVYGNVAALGQTAEVNAAHTADATHAAAIANAMIQTFAFATTGAGENEAFYSPPAETAGQTGTVGQDVASSSGSVSGSIGVNSVSPTPVSVGGTLTVNGEGFLGHDTIVWISNGTVNGVLWGGMPQDDSNMTMTVPAKACTQYIGASGLPCPSYLIVNPGIYTLTVSNQNGTTDPVYIKVQ